MGLNGRFDPEAAYIERDELANELNAVARALERQRQAGVTKAPHATDRRSAALVGALRLHITQLEAMLAQAIRQRPRRRHRPSDNQLTLPLPEEPHGPNQ